MNTRRILVRNAEIDGNICDLIWHDGVIERVGDSLAVDDHDVLDADGGAVIPGLHDHHLHLMSLAASRASVVVGPPEVHTLEEFVDALTRACRQSRTKSVRAVGYHESVAGELTTERLDELVPDGHDVAIRVQHRTGQMWILNNRALAHDFDVRPVSHDDLLDTARELASYGVTGVTDMTPYAFIDDAVALSSLSRGLPVRLTMTGGVQLVGQESRLAPSGVGPVKFLPPDHGDVDIDSLRTGVARAHEAGRAAAIHCVTRIGIIVATEVFKEVGVVPGDRIEHGGVIPDDVVDDISRLGLIVVTQPNFVCERGDQYLTDVDLDDQPFLWRCGSLQTANIGVAGATDAPFGHPDPWRAMTTAIDRRTVGGRTLLGSEAITPDSALALFIGSPSQPTVPRFVRAGERTDLCVLTAPLAEVLQQPSARYVRATIGKNGLTQVRS